MGVRLFQQVSRQFGVGRYGLQAFRFAIWEQITGVAGLATAA